MSLGWEDPLEEEIQPTSVFLPGKSHRQRSLRGFSPWGRKESDTTEQLTTAYYIYIIIITYYYYIKITGIFQNPMTHRNSKVRHVDLTGYDAILTNSYNRQMDTGYN